MNGKIKQTKQRLFTHTEDTPEGKKVTKSLDMVVKTKDAFFLGYLEHIGYIAKLPRFQLQTLLCIAKVLEYHTGEFQLGEKDMVTLTECSGLKEGSIRSAVSHLKRKNILESKGRNWYTINPAIMWKGGENERQDVFELIYRWKVVGGQPTTPPFAIKPNQEFLEQTDIIVEQPNKEEK